ETLKPIAIAEGIINKNAKFDNVFSSVIKNNGRASEFLLISRYSMTEPRMIKQLPFGLEMMAKGKLPLSIDRMENTRELEAIFKLGEKGESKIENKEIKEKDREKDSDKEKEKEPQETKMQENENEKVEAKK
ncbi:partial heterodisulfide reductase subunit C2, partial [Methanosarcinales archaeon]